MFVGRVDELKTLKTIQRSATASLVVCKGRRRIGKSRLINEYAKGFTRFISIQGLAPTKDQTNQDQLDYFMSQLSKQSTLPQVSAHSWDQVFNLLASIITQTPTLILLDEISWMGKHDPNFPGYLKAFWDSNHVKFDNLVICLCGSISTWIEENILQATQFVGRISLVLTLKELDLKDSAKFFAKTIISATEKLRYMAITGGVPRYLEEINLSESFENNINFLAFSERGLFFNEFDNLFNSSFDKEREIYGDIINVLKTGHLVFAQIAKKLKATLGGNLTKYLDHLIQAGFITKDLIWGFDGSLAKQSRYRLSDNYLRFYLRCIEPKKAQIKQGIKGMVQIENMPNWRAILGLQFENLVYNNLNYIIEQLEIVPSDIISIGPYIQKANTKNKGGCQCDLMLITKFDTAYLCEIKFKTEIGLEVVREIEKKIEILKRPKYLSIRPVLIYAGNLQDALLEKEYFYRTVNLERCVC